MLSLLKGLTLDETLKEQIDALLFEMNNEQRFPIKWEISDNNYADKPKIISNVLVRFFREFRKI